jgi:hypothetical protein
MTVFDCRLPVLLCALGLAMPAGASDYQSLAQLFEDWRAFERPPLLDGAPDYTRERFEQRQPAFLEAAGGASRPSTLRPGRSRSRSTGSWCGPR